VRFVPEHGVVEGAWWSIFHSVSAFNNAGFALPGDNLIGHRGEVLVPLVTSMLFIVGGIGFTVVADLRRTRTFRLLSLHTKLMLVGTLVINAIAFSLFMLLEYGNPGTLGPLGPVDKVIAAWFQAVTPRTAGFNTLDYSQMEDSTILMTMLLMFIGGGSASTASGIKLSTFIVIVLAVVAFLRGRTEPRAFDRRIATETVYKAMSVTAISALLLGFGMFVLVAIEPQPLVALVFEAVSAFGTVGLSLGVTPDLHAAGQLVICVLMFAGRIGPLSLVFVLARRQSSRISYPKGDVLTG
jgi:trk system potassium uptake protein TrkH